MLPYSGLKAIHDQMIEESLERQRLYGGQAAPRRSLLQTFGKVLAHFTIHSDEKQEIPLPGCAQCLHGDAR